ncbi:unnamed protein product, partial [Ectocarpus sp. 12 AP-2014]
MVYGAPLLAVLLLALATGHQSPLAVSSTATRDAAPSSSPCIRLCLFANTPGVSRQRCSRCSQRDSRRRAGAARVRRRGHVLTTEALHGDSSSSCCRGSRSSMMDP